MTYRKTHHVLPEEVVSAFARITDTKERNAYARALRNARWTLQSISDATGLTRERIRQIAQSSDDDDMEIGVLPVPEPPRVEKKPPREYVEPAPEKLARLLELKGLAQQVRSNSTQFREEAEEYSRLIAEVHLQDGVPLYRLALRLGVTHGALRFRLARYGYKPPKSGDSRVYRPIKSENRHVD